MMQRKSVFKNGLRVVTQPMKGRDSVALGFWVAVGGRYEDDRLKGAAHFLEHIVFKGSRKYSCEQIKALVEGVGGSLNAFTSEEQTCFYAKIPSRHYKQAFDVLSDMVLYPTILPADVRKEKTVIVEEIKMYHDLPQYFVLELLDALMWPGHPLGKNLAGTPETVLGISNRDLKAFHKTHYIPGNIVVAACGGIDHQSIVRLANERVSKPVNLSRQGFIKADNVQLKARVKFHQKNIEQMHLALGMTAYDEWHKDRYALILLNIILGGNMSSRLFVELREKRGLAYSVSSSYKTLHDTGLFMIRAGVDSQKLIDAVSLILSQLTKIKRNGVGISEFKRARDYVIGQLLLGLEDTMDHMLWIGEAMTAKNELKIVKSVVRACQDVTEADIRRVAKDVLSVERFNLAVVGPVRSQQEGQLCRLLGI